MSRKQFIESVGATCRNWTWSWSFVNPQEKFVIFGLWDVNKNGLIFDQNKWNGNGRNQAIEHIDLIENHGYQLKTFAMQYGRGKNGKAKIKSFARKLENKILTGVSGRWYALSEKGRAESSIAEEVVFPEQFEEGATKIISVNAYERNIKARKKCIAHYGCNCFVCGFNFEKNYGAIGKDFIHVHHEVPLSEIKKEYKVDPIKHLKPLCPNCHAVIHRTNPPLGVEYLKNALKQLE
jgi:5-methylcytosine-specific restriction protein A